jgi:hypothetical protein
VPSRRSPTRSPGVCPRATATSPRELVRAPASPQSFSTS